MMNQIPVSDSTPFKKGQTVKIMEVGDGTLTVKTNGYKITLLKVIGQIVVALLGLAGTAIGLWSSSKSDDTQATLKATVENMSKEVIPAMRELTDELRRDNKVMVNTISDVRERIAKVEGKLEARHRPPRHGSTHVTAAGVASDEDGVKDEDQLEKVIKRLDKPQTKTIPDMNFQKIQMQAQEAK